MNYDDHHSISIIMRNWKDKAKFPTHKKSHNPHPQREGVKITIPSNDKKVPNSGLKGAKPRRCPTQDYRATPQGAHPTQD